MPLDSAFSKSTLKKKKHVFKQDVPTPVLKNAGVGIPQSNRCGLSYPSQVFRLPLENRRSKALICRLETSFGL